MERAMDFASTVLPTPGTSSMSRCPRHKTAMSVRSTASCFPTITRSTLAMTRSVASLISRTESRGRFSSFTRVCGPAGNLPGSPQRWAVARLTVRPHSFLNFACLCSQPLWRSVVLVRKLRRDKPTSEPMAGNSMLDERVSKDETSRYSRIVVGNTPHFNIRTE